MSEKEALLENIEKNTNMDVSCLNYKRTREIFCPMVSTDKYIVPHVDIANLKMDKINLFLQTYDIKISRKLIAESCLATTVIEEI